jgi:dihydrodipicolinate synthase/N-acetylneuraminate lyase
VNGGANLAPRLYVDLFHAARAGDLARMRELHAQVMRLSDSIYRVGHHSSAIIKGLKCALSLRDICDDFMAEPFHRFRDAERTLLHERLETLHLP